jgi:poly(A) polymerase
MSEYEPVYDTINPDPPTEADRFIDSTLFAYSTENIILESEQEMQHRNSILAEVKRIFQEWVRFVATDILALPEEEAQEGGGQLFVSGSHRLGVREPGADIDTVCVAPRYCTREHFFTSLKEKFLKNPEVLYI